MLFSRKPNSIQEAQAALKKNLMASKEEFELARSNFEQVTEPDLIDCYIYALNAASLRYKYLLNQARDAGI